MQIKTHWSRKKDKLNGFRKKKLNLSVQTPETGQTIYGSSGKYYFCIFLAFEIEIILSYIQFFKLSSTRNEKRVVANHNQRMFWSKKAPCWLSKFFILVLKMWRNSWKSLPLQTCTNFLSEIKSFHKTTKKSKVLYFTLEYTLQSGLFYTNYCNTIHTLATTPPITMIV